MGLRLGWWLLPCSAVDILIVSTLALNGWLMAPLPLAILGGVLAAAIVLAVVMDGVKVVLFRALRIA